MMGDGCICPTKNCSMAFDKVLWYSGSTIKYKYVKFNFGVYHIPIINFTLHEAQI